MKQFFIVIFILIASFSYIKTSITKRQNILIAISDDQSYPHTSATGCKFINFTTQKCYYGRVPYNALENIQMEK